MKQISLCQSCSMPLDNVSLLGTEKDGSPSKDYCRYCYQTGSFINPKLKLDEMKIFIKSKMEEMKIEKDIISKAMESLPHLKRWAHPQLT